MWRSKILCSRLRMTIPSFDRKKFKVQRTMSLSPSNVRDTLNNLVQSGHGDACFVRHRDCFLLTKSGRVMGILHPVMTVPPPISNTEVTANAFTTISQYVDILSQEVNTHKSFLLLASQRTLVAAIFDGQGSFQCFPTKVWRLDDVATDSPLTSEMGFQQRNKTSGATFFEEIESKSKSFSMPLGKSASVVDEILLFLSSHYEHIDACTVWWQGQISRSSRFDGSGILKQLSERRKYKMDSQAENDSAEEDTSYPLEFYDDKRWLPSSDRFDSLNIDNRNVDFINHLNTILSRGSLALDC